MADSRWPLVAGRYQPPRYWTAASRLIHSAGMIRFVAALGLAVLTASGAAARQAPAITSPRAAFGFNFGDDYQLATYTQLADYWRTLDRESDRLVVQEIGKTSEGRPHLMAVVTSPANHARLAHYKSISQRLGFAEGLTDDQARALAQEGKAVVWIDGGLHANETLGAQQLGEMVYQMVTRTDEETRRFLDEVIILFVHANPDGHELVASWYMRTSTPASRTLAGLPRLYHQYIGHDNNRDFFASTQLETENINRTLYHEWMPQLLYNHHQSGPAGTVLWSSPQRDPYNYNLDALLILGLQALGTHLHQRLAVEGKPGATMAAGGPYDGWWNGGIRNTGNFHNIIAILTETIGSPTPMRIPLVMARQLPSRDLPNPIAPQPWHFRQSVDYSIAMNRAVLDYAARNREHLLFNIYRMGKNSIERGSRDSWTPSPTRYQTVAETLGPPPAGGPGAAAAPGAAEREAAAWAELRKPEHRDPRGYIIPSDQPDFPTAVKFVNALREVNVRVQRATREFEVAGTKYPAGSFVVMTDQAFRPHVLDMFEPQDHPNVFPVPGGPPTPPYDNAGWTLAFQMGVVFDRVLEPFTGPFERITDWNVAPPPGRMTQENGAAYAVSRLQNDSVRLVNRLLAAGETVSADSARFYVPRGAVTAKRLQAAAAELGVDVSSGDIPSGAVRLRTPRIGLWDRYGGSMEAGWTRWVLEQFQFPFTRVFAQQLDAGNLHAAFDVLVFVDGAIPADTSTPAPPDPPDVPAEFRPHLGRVTVERTVPQLRAFVEAGGTIVAIGSSAANLARHLQLPVTNHLVENGTPLPRAKYFVPGSVLGVKLEVAHPLTAGLRDRADVFFENSPVFAVPSGAAVAGVAVRPIATFDSRTPLRSGWAWGQHYLSGGIPMLEVTMGKGHVVLYGPEILQRAQPHGTFKLLFNALYASVSP
jgi:hypothetical protein